MKKLDIVYSKLDSRVKSILLITDGWLVGSSMSDLIDGKEPNDFDIIVPSRELYQKILTDLTTNYTFKVNNYGGIKVDLGDFELDIWTEELSHFLLNSNNVSYLYNHRRRQLLKNV